MRRRFSRARSDLGREGLTGVIRTTLMVLSLVETLVEPPTSRARAERGLKGSDQQLGCASMYTRTGVRLPLRSPQRTRVEPDLPADGEVDGWAGWAGYPVSRQV